MSSTRRAWLRAAALAGGVLPLAACERLLSRVSRELGQNIPAQFATPASADIDPVFHLLSRTSYGLWPGDWQRA